MNKESPTEYRPNVAIIVINDAGLILACERSDIGSAWQLPQGGIEPGETPEEAMLRELLEEIGTNDITVLGKLPETIQYDWPTNISNKKGFRGQSQTYFLAQLNPTAEINLEKTGFSEFKSYAWVSSSEFISKITGFKKDSYVKALELLDLYFPNILKSN